MKIRDRARNGWAALVFVWVAVTSPLFAVADDAADPPTLLSAFFGLDNALPFRANMLCLGASGRDGMPVILSHTIDSETLEAEDFEVVTRSGAKQTPHCITLRPAEDPGELRTVLLIGEFGNANDDPPGLVRIVGDLKSDGSEGKPVNFRGSDVAVTPLDKGPSLVLAERIALSNLAEQTRGTVCPDATQQVVRVTWAGGVRRPNREELGDAERMLYSVTVERADGSTHKIAPAALADLADGDNNHLLCLDTAAAAVAVGFPAGYLVDPNGDLNPDTHITVGRGMN